MHSGLAGSEATRVPTKYPPHNEHSQCTAAFRGQVESYKQTESVYKLLWCSLHRLHVLCAIRERDGC